MKVNVLTNQKYEKFPNLYSLNISVHQSTTTCKYFYALKHLFATHQATTKIKTTILRNYFQFSGSQAINP